MAFSTRLKVSCCTSASSAQRGRDGSRVAANAMPFATASTRAASTHSARTSSAQQSAKRNGWSPGVGAGEHEHVVDHATEALGLRSHDLERVAGTPLRPDEAATA